MKLTYLQLIVFFVSFGIDRISKSIIPADQIHWNAGFILETFPDASTLLRVVFISSLYGFLFFTFFLIQKLIPDTFKSLKIAITLFFSSISANAFDRIIYGAVIDFIPFPWLNSITIYFNIADAIMWVATLWTLHSIYHAEAKLWKENTLRKKWLINHQSQIKSAAQGLWISASSMMILLLFSHTYFARFTEFNRAYLFSGLALTAFFSWCVFIVTLFLSHRSAGALHAFENYVDKMIENECNESLESFSLRKTDDHQELQRIAEKLRSHLARKQ